MIKEMILNDYRKSTEKQVDVRDRKESFQDGANIRTPENNN